LLNKETYTKLQLFVIEKGFDSNMKDFLVMDYSILVYRYLKELLQVKWFKD